MRRVLRPGGALITVLPTQFASPSYRFFGKWTGEGPPRHVSYFTKQVFEDRLRQLGFSVHFSRQNVEFRKVLSILLRRRASSGTNGVALSSASAQESNSPFVRAVKSAVNLAATGFGVGDELTTIAVKNSVSTH